MFGDVSTTFRGKVLNCIDPKSVSTSSGQKTSTVKEHLPLMVVAAISVLFHF